MAISGTRTTGDAVSFGDCYVGVDIGDTGTYAAVDSWSTEVTVSGGEIPFAETRAFTGSAEVTVGAKGTYTVEITFMYTETSNAPFQNLWDQYEANNDSDVDVQWSPKGAGAGGFEFSTAGGKLTNMTPPTGNAEATEPNLVTLTIQAGSIARGTEA